MLADSLTALLMGLAGAGHCLVMCGGLAGAFSATKPSFWQLLSYNSGRIVSYMLAGALVGAAVAGIATVTPHHLLWLRLFAALLLIAFGLQLGGWWSGLQYLERLGKPLWQKLQPHALNRRNKAASGSLFVAGMLWGWLPCGLVYSALSWAAISGSSINGALFMLLFGLGTLPAMLAFGWFSRAVQSIMRSQGFRRLFGIIMLGYGVWTLIIALRQYSVLF